MGNSYSGLTTVNEGTLLLNKTPGVNAFAGTLTIGNNLIVPNATTTLNGGANSQTVRLLQSEQIPDAAGAVTINSTGLLDLNGFNETLGSQAGTTGLTLTFGNITTGAGTLYLDGDLVVGNAATAAAANGQTVGISTISGNLDLGSDSANAASNATNWDAPRTFTINHNVALPDDLIISANLFGSNDINKAGAGVLTLQGTNTGLTNSYSGHVYETAGTIAIGSGNALGSGPLYLIGTLIAENGAQTISNPVYASGAAVVLAGGNQLVLAGPVDLTAATTITVNNATFATITGTLGESFASATLGKSGVGFLELASADTASNTVTVNAGGGTLLLDGAGTAINVLTYTVNTGGTIQLDNGTTGNPALVPGQNVVGRLNPAANLTLAGGAFDFIGAQGAASSETINSITITFTANAAITTDTLLMQSGTISNSSALFTVASATAGLTRVVGAELNIVAGGQELGTSANQLIFFTPPTLTGGQIGGVTDGILPWALLTSAASGSTLSPTLANNVDFVTYGGNNNAGTNTGIGPATFSTSISPGANGNVKLVGGSSTISGAATINGLILFNDGVDGATTLDIASGGVTLGGPDHRLGRQQRHLRRRRSDLWRHRIDRFGDESVAAPGKSTVDYQRTHQQQRRVPQRRCRHARALGQQRVSDRHDCRRPGRAGGRQQHGPRFGRGQRRTNDHHHQRDRRHIQPAFNGATVGTALAFNATPSAVQSASGRSGDHRLRKRAGHRLIHVAADDHRDQRQRWKLHAHLQRGDHPAAGFQRHARRGANGHQQPLDHDWRRHLGAGLQSNRQFVRRQLWHLADGSPDADRQRCGSERHGPDDRHHQCPQRTLFGRLLGALASAVELAMTSASH